MLPRFRCFVQQVDKDLAEKNVGYSVFLRYDCQQIIMRGNYVIGQDGDGKEVFAVILGQDTDLVIIYDEDQKKAVMRPEKIKR